MAARILSETCIHCGVCIDECPEAAIAYAGGNVPVVDKGSCTGCGTCVDACCSGAIRLEQGSDNG